MSVSDSDYYDRVLFDPVEERVRKAREDASPDTGLDLPLN